MSLKIGLCGSHRTGKTTLAKAIANQCGIPFIPTHTSQVFQAHGLDPAQPLDFAQRLWIQQHIIHAAQQQWATALIDGFVTDRTPLDFLAYTLSDILGSTEVNYADLQAYIDLCLDTTNTTFGHLVVVQPGIPLIYETGKAALNPAYIEHLNTVVLGLCQHEYLTPTINVIPRQVLDLNQRVAVVMAKII